MLFLCTLQSCFYIKLTAKKDAYDTTLCYNIHSVGKYMTELNDIIKIHVRDYFITMLT